MDGVTVVGHVVLSADEAVARIPDDATVALTGSGGGILEPGEILGALERRFLGTETPTGLTFVHALGLGDRKVRGTNRFAHEGLVRRVIGGHWTWSPTMLELVRTDRVAAHSWPAGAISQLLREIGARRPGLITRTGLGTFVDPRNGGGRFNKAAQDDPDQLIEVVEFDGSEYLRFKPFPVDVAIIRGDTADPAGNISCVREAAHLDALAAAQAAHACGGLVIAQVKTVSEVPLDPQLVAVPGLLVDIVVPAPEQWQTYAAEFDPSLCGRAPEAEVESETVDAVRALIARRAAAEIRDGDVLNVGFGVSALVVPALVEQGRGDAVTLAIEQGLIGGVPVAGDLFGASRGPSVVHASTTQFDLFSGGLLDVCALGMAQVGADGSVNVSRIAGGIVGPGGFIDISQYAPRAVFCGTFTARGLDVVIDDGQLEIRREGTVRKFVAAVDEVTYSGHLAVEEGRTAVYVTERAVFELTAAGLELIEVAPGVDIERDILAHMGFTPVIRAPRPMAPELFRSVVAGAR